MCPWCSCKVRCDWYDCILSLISCASYILSLVCRYSRQIYLSLLKSIGAEECLSLRSRYWSKLGGLGVPRSFACSRCRIVFSFIQNIFHRWALLETAGLACGVLCERLATCARPLKIICNKQPHISNSSIDECWWWWRLGLKMKNGKWLNNQLIKADLKHIWIAVFLGWILWGSSPARTIDKIDAIRKCVSNSRDRQNGLEPRNNQAKELEDLKFNRNQNESEFEACLATVEKTLSHVPSRPNTPCIKYT